VRRHDVLQDRDRLFLDAPGHADGRRTEGDELANPRRGVTPQAHVRREEVLEEGLDDRHAALQRLTKGTGREPFLGREEGAEDALRPRLQRTTHDGQVGLDAAVVALLIRHSPPDAQIAEPRLAERLPIAADVADQRDELVGAAGDDPLLVGQVRLEESRHPHALYQSSTSTTNPPSVIVLLALLVPHLKKSVSAVEAVVSTVVVPLTMSGACTASTRAEVVGRKTEPVPSTAPLAPVLRQVKT